MNLIKQSITSEFEKCHFAIFFFIKKMSLMVNECFDVNPCKIKNRKFKKKKRQKKKLLSSSSTILFCRIERSGIIKCKILNVLTSTMSVANGFLIRLNVIETNLVYKLVSPFIAICTCIHIKILQTHTL